MAFTCKGVALVLKNDGLEDGQKLEALTCIAAPGDELVEVGGTFSNGCRYPGDPEAPYGETMNCRCTLVAAFGDEGEARRSSRLGGMSYEEWKRGRSATSVEIDEMTPCLRRLSDDVIVQTRFEDYHVRTKKDFAKWEFDWTRPEKEGYSVKALYAEGDSRVQGLISYAVKPNNRSVFVDTVESAPHNNSHNRKVPGKEYAGVGAHLFAEAVKMSYEMGYNGYIDFFAKTSLVDYYRREIGAELIAGSQHMAVNEDAARPLYERYYGNKS